MLSLLSDIIISNFYLVVNTFFIFFGIVCGGFALNYLARIYKS